MPMRFREFYEKNPRLFANYIPVPLRYTYQSESGEVIINFALFPPFIRGIDELSSKERKEIGRNLMQILAYWEKRGFPVPKGLRRAIAFSISISD